MQTEIDSMEAVARAVDRITKKGRFAELKLVNGIVLQCKPVPPLLLNAVMAEFPDPEPPTVYLEEQGRNEPNPNDPAYRQALLDAGEARDLAVNNVVLATGTSIISIPEGYYKPEDEEWVAGIEFAARMAGKEIKVEPAEGDPTTRYLQWLRWYACESGMDIALIQSLPYHLAGIREGEIDEVLDSFRGVPERGADPTPEVEAGGEDGDRDNRAARRSRSRTRGTRS